MRHLIKAVFFAVAITGWIVGFADTDRARNYTSRCRQAARRVADGARGVVDASKVAITAGHSGGNARTQVPPAPSVISGEEPVAGSAGTPAITGLPRPDRAPEKDERTPSAQTQEPQRPFPHGSRVWPDNKAAGVEGGTAPAARPGDPSREEPTRLARANETALGEPAKPKRPAPYTDIVLDARGFDVVPALCPRIYTTTGMQLYPFKGGLLEKVAPGDSPEVRYVHSLDEAKRAIPRFGEKPLVLKTVKVLGKGKTDLVVSAADVSKLAALRDSRLLHGDGYVAIVID